MIVRGDSDLAPFARVSWNIFAEEMQLPSER